MIRRKLTTTALGIAAGLSISAAQAAVIDLGFVLDESGSITASDFALANNALASALEQVPVADDNTYRVGVVGFADTAEVVVGPTLIEDESDLDGVQAQIRANTQLGGNLLFETNIALGLDTLVEAFSATGGLGDTSLINLTTDGLPNLGAPDPQQASLASAGQAAAAGWDGLSVEAVGQAVNVPGALDFLAQLAYPAPSQIVATGNPLPDPTATGFVVQVAGFEEYQEAIAAKVGEIVQEIEGGGGSTPAVIPLPAGMPLLLGGLAAIAVAARRRQG